MNYGIKVFNADKGLKIDTSIHSDWLIFEARSIRWVKNNLNYLLQIYPHFDYNEKIISWTLYGCVSYDTETDRYLSCFTPAGEVPIDYIAKNTARFLQIAYDHISAIKKEDIPHAVEFTKY